MSIPLQKTVEDSNLQDYKIKREAMTMKSTVTKMDFQDAFKDMGREKQFSYDGLEALFDYLESYEEDTGEDIELDVIALCCEYTEYADLAEFQNDYDAEDYPDMEAIEEHTQVIRINDDAFIIQQF